MKPIFKVMVVRRDGSNEEWHIQAADDIVARAEAVRRDEVVLASAVRAWLDKA